MTNVDWSVNMPQYIAHIFEPLRRLVWPLEGRHRRANRRSSAVSTGTPTTHLPHVPIPPLRDEEIGIVRPHLVAHEQQEAWRQRGRRRALRLAVHGIDVCHRLIHGAEVTA
jgi:hypothetical protein